MASPTISGYTTVYNPIKMRYPFIQTIKSLLLFCDEVVVVDAGSTDGTISHIKEFGDRVKLYIEPVNFNHPRWAIHIDGYLKAKAREKCTSDVLFQIDCDELLCKNDILKTRYYATILDDSRPLIAFPVIEFWGSTSRIRADINPFKPRMSINHKDITHGIPVDALCVDETDHEYPKPFLSDTCNYISKSTKLSIPCAANQDISKNPLIYHLSWLDIGRKIRHYRSFWHNFHKSMYALDNNDTSDTNVMFDKPWSEVTDEDINEYEQLLLQNGPRIFHTKKGIWHGYTTNFNDPLPELLQEWIQN
jgi:glycosyltransferase involved in cell wall biosynthesis